ncbi:MAG: site-specific DNA-methyltransferase [Ignavibacteria bacterium]|mgnify:CR=1 FL=1|jgi:DNA modification methylase|nr:site-specific DNA-methyltransferase [Ignavibacteria bacterium]
MSILKERMISPNKLPFLQSQVLQKIYIDLSKNKKTDIEEIAYLTDYKRDSKILNDAVTALVEKKFLSGSIEDGFSVPNNRIELYNSVISKNDYEHKTYSTNILSFCYVNKINENSSNLFEAIKSISDYNSEGVCHRWYDYLEDFPYQLIEEKFKEYSIAENSLVVEPFAGSGTTNVSAKMFNINSIGFDANPLMCFISRVKTTWDINIKEFESEVFKVANEFLNKIHDFDKLNIDRDFLDRMPKKEINQWLSLGLQKEVVLLKKIINSVKNEKIRDLLLLAMSRSALDASFVSFCPGTTFYPFREKEEFWNLFTNKVVDMYLDLQKINNVSSQFNETKIINDSCLNAGEYIKKDSVDFIITSPPYPNDLEYTRQTRLEMYMLDFVRNMNDVQKIKRIMVKGSTKLIYKESNSEKYIKKFDSVFKVSNEIYAQTKDKNWGFDYPRMVREYFGDMFLCLEEFYPLMKKGAHFLLVVGDQTVKGVYIPVSDILIEMGYEIGYSKCTKELFRNRRSTGHDTILPEEIVILEK